MRWNCKNTKFKKSTTRSSSFALLGLDRQLARKTPRWLTPTPPSPCALASSSATLCLAASRWSCTLPSIRDEKWTTTPSQQQFSIGSFDVYHLHLSFTEHIRAKTSIAKSHRSKCDKTTDKKHSFPEMSAIDRVKHDPISNPSAFVTLRNQQPLMLKRFRKRWETNFGLHPCRERLAVSLGIMMRIAMMGKTETRKILATIPVRVVVGGFVAFASVIVIQI